MKKTHLQHHPLTGYTPANKLRPLPEDLSFAQDCSDLISFRTKKSGSPDQVIKKVHAGMRPLGIYGDGSYCFYGIQSDSPLAPLFLWDAAHFLKVGEQITVIEDTKIACFLDREYFKPALECTTRIGNKVAYKKVAKLPAEADDDLDSWTFGLPVGPEDATVLNAVVKRILELDIPNKEILLCGTPGGNFAYPDQVRIIGEDITAPPVQICKKKNRLAQEAKYNNLVILHDRVFLPSHFGEMVRRFGPRYPLMTLQSMFFDNRLCMHPRRYSDFGMSTSDLGNGIKGLHRTSGKAVTVAPSAFTELERSGFCFANAMRYNNDVSYPTGSLYICRKEVWNAYPLDEALYWVEYEDIEHGTRCSKAGIPTRLNTFGITQTVTSRALLGSPVQIETCNGAMRSSTPNYFSVLPKKPLLRMDAETALARLQQFSFKYVSDDSLVKVPTGLQQISARQWVQLINEVVQHASFSNDIKSVRSFLADFEKFVLLDQMPDNLKHHMEVRFLASPNEAKRTFVIDCWPIRNMIKQRFQQSWFFNSPSDYFHDKILSMPGILISAIQLYMSNGSFFYFNSLKDCIRSIYNSTPFTSYTKTVK